MGWAGGSELLEKVIEVIADNVPEISVRKEMYATLIEEFENAGCDTIYECKGNDDAFDEAFDEFYPDFDDEG